MNQNGNDFPSYEEYIRLCDDNGVDETDRMTKEEYENDFVLLSKQIKEKNLSFIPALPGGRSIGRNVSNGLGAFSAALGLMNTFNANYDNINQGVAAVSNASKAVMDEITRVTSGVIKTKPFDDAGGPGPSGPGGAGGGGVRTNPFDAQRLNYNAKPVEVRWNTNIVPNTFSPYFIEAELYSSPLHITCARFAFPDTDATIAMYMDSFITMAYQNAVQRSVSFSVNMQVLNPRNLLRALNDISFALQVYYSMTSVITYTDGAQNKNEGMLRLRSLISAQDLSDLYILQRMLLNIPIPPKLMELMFYIMQNFQSSSLPGSSIIKILPVSLLQDPNTGIYSPGDAVNNCINQLMNPGNREIFSLLSRACPSWINSQLLSAPPTPIHDPQFSTLFANLPFMYTNTIDGKPHNSTGPILWADMVNKDKGEYYIYSSYVDILDGGIFGLFTGWDHTYNMWLPGLMKPIATPTETSNFTYNRFSFVQIRGETRFDPLFLTNGVGLTRGETYVFDMFNGLARPNQPFGTERCEQVTSNTVRQSAFALIEWLMSFDDIGAGTKQRDSNSKFGKGRSRSKSRGKSKRNK